MYGLLAWAVTPTSTITVVAAGNLGETRKSTPATPLAQNNGSIFNVIYSYSAGPLTISPYLQYARASANPAIGIDRPAETAGVAVLARYAFTEQFALAGRVEYIASIGGGCSAVENCTPTNLLYGPGSRAWSVTLTPTYQQGIFFARGEVSYTRIDRPTPGYAFGANLDQRGQTRGMIEAGILFWVIGACAARRLAAQFSDMRRKHPR